MRVGFEYSVNNERILANVLRKYFQIFQNHSSLTSVRVRADGLRSVFTNLGILFDMPFPVKTMLPEWTDIRVSLMIPFAVGTLEGMRARLALFGFKSRQSLGPPLQGTLLKPQEVFSRELSPTY